MWNIGLPALFVAIGPRITEKQTDLCRTRPFSVTLSTRHFR